MAKIRIKTGLRNRMTPPGGWVDVEPVTGIACRACCFAELVTAEMKVLKTNNKPIPPDIADQVDERVASRLPSVWVYDVDAPTTPVQTDSRKILMSLKSVQDKTARLIAAWRKAGTLRCSAAEAEARAKICVSCQYNSPAGCLTCAGVFRWLETQIGGRLNTSFDKRLHVCSVDQVFGKVNVWLHDRIFKAMIPAGSRPKTDRYSADCWKKAILETMLPAQGGVAATRQIHNLDNAGSNPAPATNESVTPPAPEAVGTTIAPSAPETVREPEPVQAVPVQAPISNEGATLSKAAPAAMQLVGQGQPKRPRGRPRKTN